MFPSPLFAKNYPAHIMTLSFSLMTLIVIAIPPLYRYDVLRKERCKVAYLDL